MFAVERFSSISGLPGTRIWRKGQSRRRLTRQIVLTVDRILRGKLGIFEFCANPDCAIRIAEARTKTGDRLPDGTPIPQDTRIIELHIWNEHVETLLAGKVSLVRGKIMQREMLRSLQYLAQYVCSQPKMADLKIIHGRLVIPTGGRLAQFEGLAQSYGF